MSRLHDALGQRSRRPRPTVRTPLDDLGWVPGARTTRRRESLGLGGYLLRGCLIGGLMWAGWWLAIGDQGTPADPVAANAPTQADPAVAPVEPVVPPPESPGAAVPDTSAPPPVTGDSVAPRPAEGPAALPPSPPTVSAILVSEGRRLAVIDGRVLGAGQRAGPWELVSVNRDAVVLRDASGVEQVVALAHE